VVKGGRPLRRRGPLAQARDARLRSRSRKSIHRTPGAKYRRACTSATTHHHTNNSGDAFMGGNTLTPEQAYRLQRGEESGFLDRRAGQAVAPARLWLVSDHAEGLGLMDPSGRRQPGLRIGCNADTLGQALQDRWQRAQQDADERTGLGAGPTTSCRRRSRTPKGGRPDHEVGGQAYTATAEKSTSPAASPR